MAEDRMKPRWSNWECLRFLYEDMNSLLMGTNQSDGSIMGATYNLNAPTSLTNSFPSFNSNIGGSSINMGPIGVNFPPVIIQACPDCQGLQGSGSSNVGTGWGVPEGGGGVVVVRDCDISTMRNKSRQEVSQYFESFLLDSMTDAATAMAPLIVTASTTSLSQPNTYRKIGDVPRISLPIDLCAPSSCSSITDVRLQAHLQGSVYAVGGPQYPSQPPDNRPTVFFSVTGGYDLVASYGSGNSFFYSENPYYDDPIVSANGSDADREIDGWLTSGYVYSIAGTLTGIPPTTSQVLILYRGVVSSMIAGRGRPTDPSLSSKLTELLTFAQCS